MTIIPKKIHYVWFGGKPKPPMILDTIESWRRVLPDYEIIGWTEKNYNIEADPWMKSMHDQGKYAFASDRQGYTYCRNMVASIWTPMWN